MSDVLGKSLWRLYIFILGVSFVILFFAMFFLWNSIVKEEANRLLYSNKIVTHSIHSLLNKNESLFKIISEQLVKNNLFENPFQSLRIIKRLLIENSELVAVNLVDVNGNIRISTMGDSNMKFPNLLKKEETTSSFKKVLQSDSLIMGRTYYSNILKQWIVPIRYRIVNSQNNVIAVLAAALKLEGKNSPWQSDNFGQNMQASIINSDYYYQYISFVSPINVPDIYQKQIDQNFLKTFSAYLLNQTGFNIEEYKKFDRGTVSLKYKGVDGLMSLGAFYYDNKYNIFIFSFNKIRTLYQKIILPFIWLLGMLVLFNTILYILFRKINNIQIKSKEDLNHQIQYDNLTKLPNLNYLKHNFRAWKSKHKKYSVVFMDLDNFKICNDLHGHYIGDKILKKVAYRLIDYFDDSICLRQGGDEFIIVTPYHSNITIKQMCNEFLKKLNKTMLINNLDFKICASIGIATSPKDGTDIDTLMRKADIAMYNAKAIQTSTEHFTAELETRNLRNALIAKELNTALERKEMKLHYQPQINGKTNRIIGVEALLRWNNSILGEISPAEFIPIAESTGFILEIDLFVLKTSLSEFNNVYKSIKNKMNDLRLSINLSVMQLSETKFSNTILSLLDTLKDENYGIMLEITESMLIDRFDKVAHSLKTLRKAGILFSLDDFGTGFSSLSYLSKLPINELKIDKNFVSEISRDNNQLTLVKSIIDLGKSLGIEVIAEGVETQKQLEILLDNGCEYFQGFYYSEPMNSKDLIAYLKKSN